MPVIAMNHEMGSQGMFVAEELAAQLGLSMVHHEVVDYVAEKMHARKSTVRRFLEGKAGMLERWSTDEGSLAIYKAEEILDLAAKGNVLIRGWGATYLLRRIPHVVCVRVCAPVERRVKLLMERLDTDEEFAREEIRRSDAAHVANMQHQFGVTWGDPLLYDIVLNTERVSIASCIEQVKLLAKQPEFQETAASRAQLEILTLEYHIRSALQSNPATAEVEITINVDDGKIVLQGIVLSEEEKRATGETTAKVAGVKQVENKLKIMRDGKFFPSARM
ncbi:MAG: cytidylate kinase family protein [Sulfuricaulis sp.]|uniref:cytidylate kinase family protein n=1 Tax=Sulfuricaulis sp. TaxID=2003553 RepID=UPI0034A4DAC9